MRATFAALCLICLATPAFADNTPIGFQNTTVPDPQNQRPLQMVVWYP
ncbi:dienelactone hydrolase, partial [Pseudomonas syringae]|nr:dienelactone hydrolase [Pseudomonas syringae]